MGFIVYAMNADCLRLLIFLMHKEWIKKERKEDMNNNLKERSGRTEEKDNQMRTWLPQHIMHHFLPLFGFKLMPLASKS